jgi:hypothetical protein
VFRIFMIPFFPGLKVSGSCRFGNTILIDKNRLMG